jgi:hypothetical protein
MSNDRSTLQRGLNGTGDQPGGWQAPTTPAGRRLPSAPRERKPVLAALAIVLVVGCALAAGYLVVQSGKRVAAVEISREVPAGQRIPLSAMTEIQVAAGTGLSYVQWSQASQVSQFYAASTIPAGTLLTRNMVAATATSTAGKAVMGLALKDGQLPRGLLVGQHIDIYDVSDANEACPGAPGSTLAANAVVLAINIPPISSGSGSSDDVEVALNPADAGAVACNASNGIVGVAALPNGGRGAAGAGGAGGSTAPGGAAGGATGGAPGGGAGLPGSGAGSSGTGSSGTGSSGKGSPGSSSNGTG